MSTSIIHQTNQIGKTKEKENSSDHALTDTAYAVRFAEAHGHELRYVRAWKAWLWWDGRRWVKDASETRAMDLASEFTASLWDDLISIARGKADRSEIGKATTALRRANSLGGLTAILKIARAKPQMAIDHDQLNQKPHLLNVANGTVDLRTGLLQPHDHNDLITQLADVNYGELADCPWWEKTLETIFAGDKQLIRYVQQLLGYSLSGDTGEHILPIAYGNGCNGKSTVWNVVLALAGDYGGLANDTLLLGERNSHPTDKAHLYQRRFVAVSEPEQSAKLKESRVKELTGDSTITARGMYENYWSFQRTHTFWMSTNHLPRITGTDDGIWRRVKLIPFLVDLREVTKPVPDLDRKLVEAEGAGILNWLLAGYADYQRNGFVEPDCVKAATSDYRQQEDEIASFVADCCILGGHHNVRATALYDAYQSWGGKKTNTVFGKAIAEKHEKKRGAMGNMYFGIGLQTSA